MEIGDSPEEAAFRAEAREWLEHHATRLDDDATSPQGNVIGERALGLPREPTSDKDVPWRQLVKP